MANWRSNNALPQGSWFNLGGAKIRQRGDEKPLANYVRVFEGMPDPQRTMPASIADIETHPQKWIRQTSIYLIRVARSDIAGDLGAFFQITANNDIGGRRATAIGLPR